MSTISNCPLCNKLTVIVKNGRQVCTDPSCGWCFWCQGRCLSSTDGCKGPQGESSHPPLDPKKTQAVQKPQLQLIPPALNEHIAAALHNGSTKYGPWNWRENKVELLTYIGAMRRHLDALLDGEDIAQDSGVHHLGHVAASCAIVLDAQAHGTLVDNRPTVNTNHTSQEQKP